MFKKISHEKQYEFNEQLVQDKVESVVTALKLPTPAVEKAQTLLKEGEKLIDTHLKIADRSEHGWVTVLEYEEDELADNFDDEKQLFRAKARAGRKLKQKSLKNAKRRSQQWGRSRKLMRASWLDPALIVGEPVQSNAPAFVGILPQLQVAKNTSQGSGGAGTSQLGPCYMCGKLG